jgi:hypothetical protein
MDLGIEHLHTLTFPGTPDVRGLFRRAAEDAPVGWNGESWTSLDQTFCVQMIYYHPWVSRKRDCIPPLCDPPGFYVRGGERRRPWAQDA